MTTAMTEDRSLERLNRLLAQAEGTNNEAERAAFMEKAQQLSTLYSISLATARAAAENKAKNALPTNKRITIGKAGQQGNANFCQLLINIASANNVRCTIAHNSTFVHLWGFKEDIEVSERLYASLSFQMIQESESYLDKGEWREEMVHREVTKSRKVYDRDGEPVLNWNGKQCEKWWTEWAWVKMPKQTAKFNFQETYALRIGVRLSDIARAAKQKVIEQEELQNGTPGTELVLREKGKEVDTYYSENCGAKGTWQGGTSSSHSASARSAGRAAADRARLGSQNEIGGKKAALEGGK